MTPRLPTLDLFSGIGGFSYALHPVCRTVGYCEIDGDCQSVLSRLMRDRRLDRAPIHGDIRTLPTAHCTAPPALVTAGFPCQDISVMGKRAGLSGARSGLFFDMMRTVVALPSVRALLFENSSLLLRNGWETVTRELRRAGFTRLAYGTFTATEVGGLHRRTRLYCIACRPNADAVLRALARVPQPRPGYSWLSGREPCARLLVRNKNAGAHERRCMLLGNAVVPQVVAYACVQLAGALLLGETDASSTKLCAREACIVCTIHDRCVYHRRPEHHQSVHLRARRVMQDRGRKMVHALWMTPAYSSWHQCRIITRRGSCLLSNQIYYDDGTDHPTLATVPKRMRSTVCTINPAFIEYLMGFPLSWTRARMGPPPPRQRTARSG